MSSAKEQRSSPTVDFRYFASMEFESAGGRRPELARLISYDSFLATKECIPHLLETQPFLPVAIA